MSKNKDKRIVFRKHLVDLLEEFVMAVVQTNNVRAKQENMPPIEVNFDNFLKWFFTMHDNVKGNRKVTIIQDQKNIKYTDD